MKIAFFLRVFLSIATLALTGHAQQPAATQDHPFVNSLGMKLVPVPGTKVLFCIHDTRRSDYEVFANAAPKLDQQWRDSAYRHLSLSARPDFPVVDVSWDDAKLFCQWLSSQEERTYRLPTDHEWSLAVGIGDREDPKATPKNKSGKIENVYPWGAVLAIAPRGWQLRGSDT